jgi:hypothetical protein
MIKSTKRCLRKMIGRAKLYYDELSTVLVEIEAVVNSRPLTYLSAEDLDEPLTPSHFLYGRRILSLPDGLSEEDVDDEEFTLTDAGLNRRLKYLNAVLNQFWKRWRGEYLLELRDSHRHHGGRSDAAPPSVGDIVLVGEEGKPRGLWKLARVSKLITGRDGHPRGAVLHVPSGGNDGVLQRPIQHLYPLEVAATTTRNTEVIPPIGLSPVSPQVDSEPTSNAESPRVRPRRAAASEARDRLAAYAILESET